MRRPRSAPAPARRPAKPCGWRGRPRQACCSTRPTARRRKIHEGGLAMTDPLRSQLTRRAFGFGAGALASSAGLGLGPARAQAATCVVGTWGGDYQNLLDANIVKPLLEPKGVGVQ